MLVSGAESEPILTPTDRAYLPPPSRIESAALILEQRQDPRGVICLVERWAEVADPTPKARLAQARAFMALGMMDRAWLRVKDLAEPVLSDGETAGPGAYDALVLAGRLFLDRGWNARARRPLELAAPLAPNSRHAEEIRALLMRADMLPSPPPEDLPEGPAETAALVALAIRHLASGSQIRAQSLLERAKRQSPEDGRVSSVLWAISGDYSSEPLAALMDRVGPETLVLSEITEEAEHTESLTRGHFADETDDQASFPSLFRAGDENPRTEETQTDATPPRPMAVMADLRTINLPEDRNEGGDTQIARVIHNDKGGTELASAKGPMHRSTAAPAPGFDLAAFRREMGVDIPAGGSDFGPVGSDFDSGLEEEDESRIVRIGHQRPEITDEPTGAGLETLDPDTTGESRAPVFGSESPTIVDPTTDAPVLRIPPPEPSSGARKRPKRRRRDSTPVWVLAIALLLLGAAGMIFLLALWWVFG